MFQRVLLDFVLKTFGLGAENETRARDPNLGKVVLYQLSYFRNILKLKQFRTTNLIYFQYGYTNGRNYEQILTSLLIYSKL